MIWLIFIGLGLVSTGTAIARQAVKARREEKEILKNDERFLDDSIAEYNYNLELAEKKKLQNDLDKEKAVEKQPKVARDEPIRVETPETPASEPIVDLKSDLEVQMDEDIKNTLEALMEFRKAIYSSDAPNHDTLRMIDRTIFDLTKGLSKSATSSDRYRAEELSINYKSLNADVAAKKIEDLLINKTRMFTGTKQDEYALASTILFEKTKKVDERDIDQDFLKVVKSKNVIKSKTVDGIDDLRSLVDETNKTLERYKVALMDTKSKYLDRNIMKINTIQHTLDRVKKDTIDYKSLEYAADYLKLFTQSTPENLEQKVEELYEQKKELKGKGYSASYQEYANNKLDAEIILLKSLYFKHTKKITNLYVRPKYRGPAERDKREGNMALHRELKDEYGLNNSSVKRSKVPLESSIPKLPTELRYTSNIENRYLDGSNKLFKDLFNEKPGNKTSASNKNDFSR